MLAAGLLGYVLRLFGFPLAPMVLAVILGPLADENIRRALLVLEDQTLWEFIIDHPIGSVLFLVVLYTFHDGIFKRGGPETTGRKKTHD
jgi:putative tricarboxylic transport membrane protein